MKKGDVYVHADIDGAISIVIKNKPGTPNAPIPPSTLSQAGALSVATSSVWESKAMMGAWWVNAEQVSKTTSTGDYIATGGFAIRGQKNHLAPAQLLLGFAVMFQVSEDSIKNHTKHRVAEDTTTSTEEVEKPVEMDPEPEEVEEDKDEATDNKDSEQTHASELENRKDDESGNEPSQVSEGNNTQSLNREAGQERSESSGDEEQDDDENEDTEGDASSIPQEKAQSDKTQVKHLSARERRLLRKGPHLDSSTEGQSSPVTQQSRSSISSSSKPNTEKKQTQTNVRGKKGKSKKIAAKYMHQDEEDRELALRVLGSAPNPKKSVEAKKSKEKQKAELEAQKQRRRAQHDRTAQAERKRQEALHRSRNQADQGEADGDLEVEDLSALPSLVGTPVTGDKVVAAIPVCAPWFALGHYKYRAKLQPGSMKKGKAVKEILGKWVSDASVAAAAAAKAKGKKGAPTSEEERGEDADGEDAHDSEGLAVAEMELIKAWRDVEIINALPVGKVRIMSGGDAGGGKGDAKQKSKAGGKGGGKGGKGSKKR